MDKILEIGNKIYIKTNSLTPNINLKYITYKPYQVYKCVKIENRVIHFEKIFGKEKDHVVNWSRNVEDIKHWSQCLYIEADMNEEI